MISENVSAVLEDQDLHLDQVVLATWVDQGERFRGRGRIVALRPRQVTVELLHPVGGLGEYAAGDLIQVPRYADQLHWFSDWRVSRLPEEPFIHKDFL